jgi:hypothetical protein
MVRGYMCPEGSLGPSKTLVNHGFQRLVRKPVGGLYLPSQLYRHLSIIGPPG